jgi:hypothetical protein
MLRAARQLLAGGALLLIACESASAAPSDSLFVSPVQSSARAEDLPAGATLKAFFDVGARARFDDPDSAESSQSSGIKVGVLDLLLTGRIRSDISGLVELVVEQEDDGGWTPDLERAQVRWTPGPRTAIEAGRLHTPLGFWNGEYHHGVVFSPLIERPMGLRFEDDGGLLPAHFVGATVEYQVQSSPFQLLARAGVCNGRGAIPDAVQMGGDLNTNKGLVGRVVLSNDGAFGWELGGSHYRETIPAAPASLPARNPLAERITNAYGRLEYSKGIVLAEGFLVRHEDTVIGDRWNGELGYVLVSWSAGSWTPYAALDAVTEDVDDPFFQVRNGFETRRILGLRVDPDERSSIRLEFESGHSSAGRWHALACQWAVVL